MKTPEEIKEILIKAKANQLVELRAIDEIRAKRIPIDKCKERWLYRLDARNIKIGVYYVIPANEHHAELHEFLGIRNKFGQRFVDAENHWDDPMFATCCPMEELCELPAEITLENYTEVNPNVLFIWLEQMEKKYCNDA